MRARRPWAASSILRAHTRRTPRAPPRAHAPATRPRRRHGRRRRTRSYAPATGLALVRAGEQRQRRPRENFEVDPRRPVLDVPEVELDPLAPGQARATVDLRPAGHPRLHVESAPLARRVPVDLVCERRAWADQAHVAQEDVPELRHLVE